MVYITARLKSFCLIFAICLSPLAAMAFDSEYNSTTNSAHPSANDIILAQAQQSNDTTENYDIIMNDMKAVIDAMKETPLRSDFVATQENDEWLDTVNLNNQGTPSPVVIEVFTSQGCSSCPPVEKMLSGLINRDDVLLLAWHVNYWDYLGWTDKFAKPEFTVRQEGYRQTQGNRSLFTPQVIVAGKTTIFNPNPAKIMATIDASRDKGAQIKVSHRNNGSRSEIELTPVSPLPANSEVQLIRYVPERIVKVRAGENRGKDLAMQNIVLSNEKLAEWDGKSPLHITVSLDGNPQKDLPEDTRYALIVQKTNSGHPSSDIFATVLLN